MPIHMSPHFSDPLDGRALRPNGFDIPLQARRYRSADRDFTIRIDSLPPHYAHTWALDLTAINAFILPIEPTEIWLDFAQGDRLIVAQPLPDARVTSVEIDTWQALVDTVVQREGDGDESGPWRVYLTLEIGGGQGPRLINLSRILKIGSRTGDEAAVVVTDDLALDTSGPLTTDTYFDARLVERRIYPPWVGHNRNTGVRVFDPPRPEKGWCLLAKNLQEPVSGFLTLAYYNEAESKLRLYLLNLSMTPDASGYQLRVSLHAGIGGPRPVQLKGAFFPLKPDPTGWSEVSVVIPRWGPETWTFVELPFLYPMASNAPLKDKKRAVSDSSELFSIYDEVLQSEWANVGLNVRVTPYLKGKFEGSLDARAVGEVVQTFGRDRSDQALWDLSAGVFDAIKTGVPLAKSLKDDLKGFKAKVIDKLADPNTGQTNWWAYPVLGLTTFAGPFAAVGAVITALDGLFGTDPEPLQLALELEIKGLLNGTLFTPLQERTYWFYLPGCCQLAQAMAQGLQQDPAVAVDQRLPRYAYPIGLIGYRRAPEAATLRATHGYTQHAVWHWIPGADLDLTELRYWSDTAPDDLDAELGSHLVDDPVALLRNPHVRATFHALTPDGRDCDYLPVPNRLTWHQVDAGVELTVMGDHWEPGHGEYFRAQGPGSRYRIRLTLDPDWHVYGTDAASSGGVPAVPRLGYEGGVALLPEALPPISSGGNSKRSDKALTVALDHASDSVPFNGRIGTTPPKPEGSTPFEDVYHQLDLASTVYASNSDRVYLRRLQLYSVASIFSTTLPYDDTASYENAPRQFFLPSASIGGPVAPRLWDVRTESDSRCVIYAGGIDTTTPVYTDRVFTYRQIPDAVQGALYIATANADKFSSGADFLSFRVNKPVQVYIAHDARFLQRPPFQRVPPWLGQDPGGDFDHLNTHIPWADGTYLAVDTPGSAGFRLFLYPLLFPPGVVRLGGNLPDGPSANFSMYAVFVRFLDG